VGFAHKGASCTGWRGEQLQCADVQRTLDSAVKNSESIGDISSVVRSWYL